jgi:hypothetical protein
MEEMMRSEEPLEDADSPDMDFEPMRSRADVAGAFYINKSTSSLNQSVDVGSNIREITRECNIMNINTSFASTQPQDEVFSRAPRKKMTTIGAPSDSMFTDQRDKSMSLQPFSSRRGAQSCKDASELLILGLQ